MKNKSKLKLSFQRGFSLVELLVVIAVIAIIAAIAIPNIANITNQAGIAKSRRNAQTIASVASAARAAGYTNAWSSVAGAITALTNNDGVGLTNVGPNNLTFGVGGLTPAEATAATDYLTNSTASSPDTLIYVPGT